MYFNNYIPYYLLVFSSTILHGMFRKIPVNQLSSYNIREFMDGYNDILFCSSSMNKEQRNSVKPKQQRLGRFAF